MASNNKPQGQEQTCDVLTAGQESRRCRRSQKLQSQVTIHQLMHTLQTRTWHLSWRVMETKEPRRCKGCEPNQEAQKQKPAGLLSSRHKGDTSHHQARCRFKRTEIREERKPRSRQTKPSNKIQNSQTRTWRPPWKGFERKRFRFKKDTSRIAREMKSIRPEADRTTERQEAESQATIIRRTVP